MNKPVPTPPSLGGATGPTPPTISLPKGGGAIRGIGEKFAANPVTGTGSLSVPIYVSHGRSGFSPSLSLSYDSGSGNGLFGLGWSLSLPSITRKTDKGLPQYREDEESDVFLLAGSEDLVPVLAHSGGKWSRDSVARTVGETDYRVQSYRPRIEGLFARVERWTNSETGVVHWRSMTKDNITTIYGKDNNSRIYDPADSDTEHPRRIFTWLISESYDDRGNAIVYEYKAENAEGVDLSQASEKNRTELGRTANRCPKRIKYGNRVSRLVEPDLSQAQWMFEVVFDYGEHDAEVPGPNDAGAWLCRHDPFSAYRAGFEVRTSRLCQRVLMFHHFPGENGVGQNCLVRSTDFVYQSTRNNTDDLKQGHPVASFINSITASGYKRTVGGYLKKSMPSIEFEYSQPVIQNEIREIDVESLENLPGGLDGSLYQWIDLDGEGLSGILTEQGNGWFYKRNLSPINIQQDNGKEWVAARFAAVEVVARQPSPANLNTGGQQFMDLAGDGQLDLVQFTRPLSGYYERTEDGDWSPFAPFRFLPDIAWSDPNVKFLDLTGDGHADVIISEESVFTWYPSLAEEGFGTAERVAKSLDEKKGPRLVFADGTQSIYLADMSGDGLTDIVRLQNGEVCYWPNLGYGQFGAQVLMDNAPLFDRPDLFDQRRIRLADIDGSGVTDILYLGSSGARVYFNQSGNGWAEALALGNFPPVDNLASVTAADLLGNGTACLVWSSTLPGAARQPMRYIDLMGGRKPHLLVGIKNNMGAETIIRYAPSTRFYLEDKLAGEAWVTKLPFPVHVVERLETIDQISRNRFASRYAYHHGYFDGLEREFRGFGMVEQWDTEEFATLSASDLLSDATNLDAASHVPPVLTKTWFHTGAWIAGTRITKQFEQEYYNEGDASLGESELSAAQLQAMLLEDTVLPLSVRLKDESRIPWNLSPEELAEAHRALKGSVLRQEVYALDGGEASDRPYSVSERNYTIELLQPREVNRHAVLMVHARETIDFHYERHLYMVGNRKLADPRVSHSMVLSVDGFGNALQSVAIGYGRRHDAPDPVLTAADKQRQSRTLITCTENLYTNPIEETDAYRAPLTCEARHYELYNIETDANQQDVTNLFRFDEMAARLQSASDGLHDIPFENQGAWGIAAGVPHRRLIECSRAFYRADDLSGTLPFGTLESLALGFDTYKLAFTPGLLASVYQRTRENQPPENLLPDPIAVLHGEGGYVDLDSDGHWWIPSGRVFYHADETATPAQELDQARAHFFLPRRFQDPFQNNTLVSYDKDGNDVQYDLLTSLIRDAVGNEITASHDYRVLQAHLLIDANGNRSTAAFDALGMVVGTAIMGKENETVGDSLDGFDADLDDAASLAHLSNPLGNPHAVLDGATTRLIYDLHRYERTKGSASPQPNVVYTLARETHVSELALGEMTVIQHHLSYSDGFGREIQQKIQAEPGIVNDGGPPVNPRWVGSGWTVFNNKNEVVRKYEPFFSATHEFEFAKQVGVSPVLFYDALARVVATLRPNHTYEKVTFDPWRQETWDVNDTVLQDDPGSDEDVGDFFARLPDADYLPTWHAERASGALGPDEQSAATKTALHAATPERVYFDSLGRAFLAVSLNRFKRNAATIEEQHTTRFELDVEGNQRSVTDARGRKVMSYDYAMLRTRIHQKSVDAGERWTLNDVKGKPLRLWDQREHQIRHEYDALQRPLNLIVLAGSSAEKVVQHLAYGEGQPNDKALNLRGKAFQQFDGAGVITDNEYDFKGNLRSSTRQLLQDYKDDPDWSQSPALESETFTSETSHDALNRPVRMTLPDASVLHPVYNEANLLEQLSVNLRGAQAATMFVTNLDYNARGQRAVNEYGNGARIEYFYDPLTFRLVNLRTTRATDSAVLQDLTYTYDPAGNIISIRDAAQQPVYFNNQVVSADNEYVYDALYRLINTEGREHVGQAAQPQTTWNDEFRINLAHPNDGQAMRHYQEAYEYDVVGNLLQVAHAAVNGNWTRSYDYDEPHPNPANNRLTSTSVGAVKEPYTYDAHGNITQMPHLPLMQWDFKDQLHVTQSQVVNNGSPEQTYYVYNATGQRVRKITERQNGTKKQERLYLGAFELYREFNGGGSTNLERETLNVMEQEQRIALVETKTLDATLPANALPQTLKRYQFGNHLGSASLELDEAGAVISYEEYYPYGSTSYQAGRSIAEVSLKRYRYTGEERDEETGLCYHGARYYAAWLGRWTSCDPAGLVDGTNLYAYARANPVKLIDRKGTQSTTLSDFERKWVAEVAMPILRFSTFTTGGKDVPIALQKRVLMVAQARAESVTKWRDDKGNFKEMQGNNMFNLQGGKGTAGSTKEPRWEYFDAHRDPASLTDAQKAQKQPVGGGDEWNSFQVINRKVKDANNTVTETKVLQELRLIHVEVPAYKTKEDAVSAYVDKLKTTWSSAYKALTSETSTKEELFAGLKSFGTHGDYKDPKKLTALLGTTSKLLGAYAEEQLTTLKKELADLHPETLPQRIQSRADEVREGKIEWLKGEIDTFVKIKAEAAKLNNPAAKP